MVLEQVCGNTWVIRSWVMIPLYKIDDHRCILLDSGLKSQREALDALLREHGLRYVGIIGSHAHMDHAGNHMFFQKEYGATVVLPLGEAGLQASFLGMGISIYNESPRQVSEDQSLSGTVCVVDRVILPEDTQVSLFGVSFEVIHTPGHSIDHIALRTPDDVVYLGDAIMTGRTLFRAKFPYVLSMADYFKSLSVVRELTAPAFVVAHFGIHSDIRSFVDMELAFLQQRMLEILGLIEEETTEEDLARRIALAFALTPKTVGDALYFRRATRAYLQYLLDMEYLEVLLTEDGSVRYRRTGKGAEEGNQSIPEPGSFSLNLTPS